jgi:hypothetical protein
LIFPIESFAASAALNTIVRGEKRLRDCEDEEEQRERERERERESRGR